MFSQACVKNSIHGRGKGVSGNGNMHGRGHGRGGVNGGGMHGWRHTAADGTHPTGMHSCLDFDNRMDLCL